MLAQEIDQKKAEAFSLSMLNMINNSFAVLMTSVGHRTGLFDKLAELPPSTSEEIAEASSLNERYVREWLGTMVTARIVEYSHETRQYYFPREHAAFLTRAASPNNMAATTQFLPLLASVEDRIVESFHKGGGVHYSEYGRFHEVMAEESSMTVVSALVNTILPGVPRALDALREGIEVLDVGCGRGRALIAMAEAFPKSRFTGYDFSEEAIADASAEVQRKDLSNIRFEVKDVSEISDKERYDLITAFDAIHDQAKPASVLSGIAKALKREGTFLMQDIRASSHLEKNLDHPLGPMIYAVSCMHCMTVSLALGGAGLGTVWGEELAIDMLKEAGFNEIEVRQYEHDIMNNFYIAKKN
jgi:2-polyprenyl-3-methyl-5-hydroxy-6-metoxy-1,4-benzoquinol methylase